MPAKKKHNKPVPDPIEVTEGPPIELVETPDPTMKPEKPKKPEHECPQCHSEMKVYKTTFGTAGKQYQCIKCRFVKTFK